MRRAALLAVLLLVAGLGAACGGDEPTTADNGSAASGNPGPTEVFGTALPRFEQLSNDPAVGRTPPVAVGTDLLTGAEVRIEAQGRPVVVAFYAHWCPHCQAEVEELTDWLADNDLPEGVDFYAVSVLEDSTRGNHPPERWLRNEGWQHPVIADTPALSVVSAFGLESVPYLVAIGSDNKVALRYAGNLGPSQLASFFDALIEGSV